MTGPGEQPRDKNAQELSRGHWYEIVSPSGLTSALVDAYGGQVRSGTVDGVSVVFPLAGRHSIGRDWRPSGNSAVIGETLAPGGSFTSFGGGEIQEENGTTKEAPVHGPFSAPWYLFIVKLAQKGLLMLQGNADGRTQPFFPDGDKLALTRSVYAVDDMGDGHGALIVNNRITNQSGRSVATPRLIEHWYQPSSGLSTAIVTASGGITRPEYLARMAPVNFNDIDTRFGSEVTGTPGEVAFAPNGEDGHIVVVNAVVLQPDGSAVPCDGFDIYRYNYEDPWTGLEPIMDGRAIEDGGSATLITATTVYASMSDYLTARADYAKRLERLATVARDLNTTE